MLPTLGVKELSGNVMWTNFFGFNVIYIQTFAVAWGKGDNELIFPAIQTNNICIRSWSSFPVHVNNSSCSLEFHSYWSFNCTRARFSASTLFFISLVCWHTFQQVIPHTLSSAICILKFAWLDTLIFIFSLECVSLPVFCWSALPSLAFGKTFVNLCFSLKNFLQSLLFY